MSRSFFSLLLLFSALLLGTSPLAAARPAPDDTIVVRLPNQAVLTLMVRDVKQLRELPSYHLDSLTSRLGGYIRQAEEAAKTTKTEQVTLQFYPAKDQPGQNLPEQIRITTRKSRPNSNRVEVWLNKIPGVTLNLDPDHDGHLGVTSGPSPTKPEHARRDSLRRKKEEERNGEVNIRFDLGLNTLVNRGTYINSVTGQAGQLELRPEGCRYVDLGFDYVQRLVGRRNRLNLLVGPHATFNNYMLEGNYRWLNNNGFTNVMPVADNRQLTKSKLATSTLTVPLMLQLQLKDKRGKNAFELGAGGFVGYRLKSWSKIKYYSEGSSIKDKDYNSFNLEDWQYGLQGTLGFRGLTLFAKYNLNELFREGQGPQAQVLSFGLNIIGE